MPDGLSCCPQGQDESDPESYFDEEEGRKHRRVQGLFIEQWYKRKRHNDEREIRE